MDGLYGKIYHQNLYQVQLTVYSNGKVERSHRVDNERFYSKYKFGDEHALDYALKTLWMPEYNENRPHGALRYQTPMHFLKQRLKEIQKVELLHKNDATVYTQKAA